ncbi:DUF4358 domain-containing protein [Tissierella sp. Yu-01]|uniref:DUF4358 domain-containing protein n=1 Tax=Tissierella sp. Yu-01 TaxID=3035694 RepID=UPI00240E5BFE|nr:DUF4358 domain-containing protein [Tissierella sp. Yu-01]WFA08028.1 DUF4358 domain-containing protein [Tissierella sp. Yu-01]
MLCLIVSGCSKETADLPEPDELYSAVADAAGLSEMIELTPEELQDIVGIDPEEYVDYAGYQASWGMSPDEIIIVRAADESKAKDIEEKLKSRVEHKRKSSEVYLTENLPIINAAVVQRDGVTVSMLITENIEDAQTVYNKLKK